MADIDALTMPKLGLAMTEGQVAAWHKEEGEKIAAGEEIADIETPKITTALESPAAGTLRRKVIPIGETVPVGALIGVLADPSTSDSDIDTFVADWQARFAAAAKEETAAAPEPEHIETPLGLLQVLEVGPADAKPIVLVHGFGADHLSFLFLQPLLAEHFRTLALDLPGHGGSTKKLPGADPASLGSAIAAAMTVRGIASAHLVGHSLGGAAALALAESEPARVSALTLISPAGLGAEVNLEYLTGFIAARRPRDLERVLGMLFAGPAPITREMIDAVLRYKRLDGVDAALKAILATSFPEGRQAHSFRHVLADSSRPARVIWGREDRIIPSAHAAGLPPHVGVTLFDGIGHMAHMEKAAEVSNLIAG